MSTFEAFFRDVAERLTALEASHSEHEARMERVFRKGKVTDVDPKKQLYRQEIGLDDDGQPVKSPWVPYAQVAGARKIHSAPSVGQQMLLVSPDGDHEQAHGIPLTFSQDNASPSQDADTHVDQIGKTKNTQKDGSWIQETEGASITMGKDSITFAVGDTKIEITKDKIRDTAKNVALVGNVALGDENADREISLRASIDTRGDAQIGNLATKIKGA